MSLRPTLRLTDAAWLAALGRVAAAIGSDEFTARLSRLFAGLIRHDMSMVVRYARFSAPGYLVATGWRSISSTSTAATITCSIPSTAIGSGGSGAAW